MRGAAGALKAALALDRAAGNERTRGGGAGAARSASRI